MTRVRVAAWCGHARVNTPSPRAPRAQAGAKGWYAYLGAGAVQPSAGGSAWADLPARAPTDAVAPTLSPLRRACATWARAEAELRSRHGLPLRASVDEAAADADPERVPFIDDIDPLLVRLDDEEARAPRPYPPA